MTKYEVRFENDALVEIETDPSAEEIFTEEYMKDFARYFYPFNTVDDHLRELASRAADSGYVDTGFWEGYGSVKGSRHSKIKEVEIINGDGDVLGTVKLKVKQWPTQYGWNSSVKQL